MIERLPHGLDPSGVTIETQARASLMKRLTRCRYFSCALPLRHLAVA